MLVNTRPTQGLPELIESDLRRTVSPSHQPGNTYGSWCLDDEPSRSIAAQQELHRTCTTYYNKWYFRVPGLRTCMSSSVMFMLVISSYTQHTIDVRRVIKSYQFISNDRMKANDIHTYNPFFGIFKGSFSAWDFLFSSTWLSKLI